MVFICGQSLFSVLPETLLLGINQNICVLDIQVKLYAIKMQ
jgi:hypothetical protein